MSDQIGQKEKGKCKSNQVVAGADGFQRINFLYQASQVVAQAAPQYSQIMSCYGDHMTSIAKKLQLKIDPTIKRNICKGCKSLLLPGKTAQVTIKGQTSAKTKGKKARKASCKFQEWKCLLCSRVRHFMLQPDYELWSEKSPDPINAVQI